MAVSTTDALFVTANVGSIFEDPTSMLKIWCDEFLSTVSRLNPKLVALHCQEVGGKNYERSMQHVTDFVKLLMSSEEFQSFDKVRIYLDEDYSSAEHFTALGNFYFIHESIPEDSVQIFNFQECKFEPVIGKEVHSENIEDVPTKEKSKFPQEIFPECKWSRKGFMRTRWNLNGTVFDLINIHLFHDASNFIAMESFPSVYCKNRQRALEHTLKRFHMDQYGTVPFFVFGDFNFRTDTQGVVKKLSEGLNAVKVPSSKTTDHAKLQYRDESSQQVVLTLGKKEFSHQDHQKLFVGEDSEWLREFDREWESFSGQLFEFDINFPPTYPYVEDSERGEMYMQTRCPSWCDRVFLSSSAQVLVDKNAEHSTPEYGLIGLNACMGDHKPVFLQAALIGGLGTVSCCVLPATNCTSCLSAESPVEYKCRLCSELPVEPSSLHYFGEPDQDHNGLVVPKFHRHTTPYTPDSTDTEPDLGEEMSPCEETILLGSKSDRRFHHSDMPSRKRLLVTSDPPFEDPPEDFSKELSVHRSVSKIPVRVQEHKDSIINSSSHVSKIPILKHTSVNQDKDSNVKDRRGKYGTVSTPSPKDNLDKRLSLPSTPLSPDGKKRLYRQMNIDEQSSDSDSASLELGEDQYSVHDKRTSLNCPEESKVEIQFSLVETSPALISHIECESDALLTAQTHGLGGSATDSGVSVSPDLSVATSSTHESDKLALEPTLKSNITEKDSSKADEESETSPLSLERFSFVRRIQSASAMERKSSFPLPSSVLIENETLLTGFGGSGSDLWEMRTCRCMSDGSWRQRSSTVSHSMLSSKTDSRIRLISTSSRLDRSLPRLQSHHSSSEEDWFEEVITESQELKAEDEQDSGFKDVKGKRNMVECAKRLSTHQEYVSGKTSDSNISSDDNASNNTRRKALQACAESVPQIQMSFFYDSDSARAIAAVGKTLVQTCFLNTQTTIKNDELVQLDDELRTTHAVNEAESGSKLLVSESGNPDEPEVKSDVAVRRSSYTSNKSKASNSTSCKSCCTVM